MYANAGREGANSTIDLRSDTVTRPSAGMREAMAAADVGDDVYGDDPTVRRLEERVASLLGKEDALFVTSGTQSNLVALLSHCGRGEEYIGGVGTHIAKYEAGGAAVLGGISPRHIQPKENGALDAGEVAATVQPDDPHFAITRLVCMENTLNGKIVPQSEIEAVAGAAREHGLSVHLDGARLMNAAVGSGKSAADLAAPADSVSLCLSKGLGAPAGSVLTGPTDFIARAKRNRKLLGGGLRQSGVLAACGLYALEHNIERLSQDHENAVELARNLTAMNGISLNHPVDTNMIWLTLAPGDNAPDLVAFMARRGIVLSGPDMTGGIRLVTHLDFDKAQIGTITDAFAAYVKA
jgi:threonine aldolase